MSAYTTPVEIRLKSVEDEQSQHRLKLTAHSERFAKGDTQFLQVNNRLDRIARHAVAYSHRVQVDSRYDWRLPILDHRRKSLLGHPTYGASMNTYSRISLLAFAVLLAACTSRDGGSAGTGTHTFGADLVTMGHTLIWAGLIAVVLGTAGWLLLTFVGAGNPIVKCIDWLGGAIVPEFIATAGGCAIVVGTIAAWVGDHLLLVGITGMLALVAWAYHRRAHLRAWIRRWLDGRKKDIVG